ncbi:hypothetical protein L798_03325 [Zootermopsis nevadensis]|uniref:Uncharacterized protein n=1 Tax=Zootermopsis nevadensis TaxID=136037 RepID=A0A067QQX0_ZOONE|nr:hypothetical protein L798_03325 [Zootermopsis nevadensis]
MVCDPLESSCGVNIYERSATKSIDLRDVNMPACDYRNVKPLSASFLSSNQSLSADRIEFQSVGSRPAAKITWWMDTKSLDNYVEKFKTYSIIKCCVYLRINPA